MNFNNLLKELLEFDMDLQWLQIGCAHTLAITSDPHKIYTWGWNDYYQLGREPTKNHNFGLVHLPYSGLKFKTATCGEDHNFLLDYENNLWCWGLNNKGQLGLGHRRNVQFPISADIFPKSIKIKEIKGKYHSTAMVSECGKAFIWPVQKTDGEYILRPVELFFPLKTPIASVSCGFQFSCFLTINGLIYSLGFILN